MNKTRDASEPSSEAAPLPLQLGLAPVRHERFAERVYDNLFHSIMTGKLAPRARLPSEHIGARYRDPEALRTPIPPLRFTSSAPPPSVRGLATAGARP